MSRSPEEEEASQEASIREPERQIVGFAPEREYSQEESPTPDPLAASTPESVSGVTVGPYQLRPRKEGWNWAEVLGRGRAKSRSKSVPAESPTARKFSYKSTSLLPGLGKERD